MATKKFRKVKRKSRKVKGGAATLTTSELTGQLSDVRRQLIELEAQIHRMSENYNSTDNRVFFDFLSHTKKNLDRAKSVIDQTTELDDKKRKYKINLIYACIASSKQHFKHAIGFKKQHITLEQLADEADTKNESEVIKMMSHILFDINEISITRSIIDRMRVMKDQLVGDAEFRGNVLEFFHAISSLEASEESDKLTKIKDSTNILNKIISEHNESSQLDVLPIPDINIIPLVVPILESKLKEITQGKSKTFLEQGHNVLSSVSSAFRRE